ncbi:hypothetical protein FVEN_g5303 [Fusarium venenatum]|uniref:Uncharacterized protein n=1 Tax=Fusarium venenatum TaxID=56646 RepID=A0A2L2U0M9_9HYPO|nr:uncharacterized protein FVRRES_08627 [Fusarium venenatum]KAG8356739.1 hypothetical protein FVEN_g5303 [Fusarium venenatum]CEI68550.1 unnamed protein product [Fusarium venenatum]
MHAKSFVLALALASSSVVEANRPRIYYPRQVKREVVNNAAPVVPDNKVVPDLEKRDPQNSFLDRLFSNNNNNDDTASTGDKESGVNFDPTIPLGLKRPGPSASALPSVVLQPTTTSMAIEEPETTEPADALTESDTGILLAPSGIVTSKTAVKSSQPAKTSAAEPKEETEAAPVETETIVQTEEPVVATEPPKEETQPAVTTAPAVKEPESVNTPKEKPVESKTEAPAPVETTAPAEQPVSTPSNKPVVSTTKKGLLDPVETLLSSILPVPAESKTTQPKPVNTETTKPKEETQPAPIETTKPKEETQPAPVETTKPKEETQPAPVETTKPKEETQPAPVETQPAPVETTKPEEETQPAPVETQPALVETETVQPADSETKSPSAEKPAPTTKEGLLDPIETLLSSVLPVPADSETKDPQPDQTESEPLPEETGTPTKEPQQQESKPQTDGQTLPTVSPPSDEATAAPGSAQTSNDGLLDPVETLLSSLLPVDPSEVKTTSPEETASPDTLPAEAQPTSAAGEETGSEQTVSGAPVTDPETTGLLPDIIPTSILPEPTLPLDETDILPIPTDVTDVTSILPEPSSPVTVSPVIPTTLAPEESQSDSPDVTSFVDPNTKLIDPTESPNVTLPDATSGVGSQPVETELPLPTTEPVNGTETQPANGTETQPAATGEPETTGAPEPTEDVTEAPTVAPTATGAASEEPTGAASEEPTGNATEPATEPIDTATGSAPTELPATQTGDETNGTATEEPTSPATGVETESAPIATDGEETSAALPTVTEVQPTIQPTSQPPVETETQPEPIPTTLVPTAADPITSIRPTATLTNTNNWLPTTIMFEPTSIPAAPTQATETSTSTGLPANIPRVILPNDPNKPIPEGSRAIQIGFLFPFNYKFLARNTVAAAQLFKYLPKGLADAGGFSKDRILIEKIIPMDTQSQWGYITALAKIHYPENMLDSLQADLMTPNSLLYNNDLEIVRNLTSVINNKIDIFGNTENGASSDSGDSEDSGSGGNDGFGNSGEGDKTAKQKATTAGIAVGAVGLSVMYGAAMFLVARRYKRKKQLGHRRASSIGSSQRSSEMQYNGNGSPALMGGALMSRDFSNYGAQGPQGEAPARPGGRDSHGSGRSGMGNSARTAFISAPVAAENSLGWN